MVSSGHGTATFDLKVRAMRAFRLIAFLGVLLLPFTAAVASAADDVEALHKALLAYDPSELPRDSFHTVTTQDFPIPEADKNEGLIDVVVALLDKGGNEATIGYFLFADPMMGQHFYDTHAALPGGQPITFPPTARCTVKDSGHGLCTALLENKLVLITADAVNGGSQAIGAIGAAYRHYENALTAIGSSEAPSNPSEAAALSICELAKSDEVAALLGGAATPSEDPLGNCIWRGNGGAILTISPDPGGPGKFDLDLKTLYGVRTVSGVGDQAYAFVSAAGFIQFGFTVGSRYITLIVQNPADPTLLADTKLLAAKIAARL
jgi:hypothetical protein